ncbi:MAG: hypothetical protein A2Y12_20825 [Planctomycetes bacterium GWF2_42_9]|nr:MAG: hypothetical protein A2Y12_20825 [Planctomycetes bacterium GWF2_42_9]
MQNDAYIAKARAQILSEDKKRADRQGLLLQRLTDALRYQQVADEIVFGFSLLSLRKGQKISEKHGKDVAAGSFAEYASAYNMLAEHAVTPELGAAWKEFVANQLTNATQKDQEKFAQMIASLYRLGGLEMWFNTVFAKGHTLDQLLKGYSSQDELFLQALGKQKGLIKSTNLEGLADPKKFEKVWNNFVDNIVSYFISPSSTGFFAQFKQAGETARILALVVMRDLVDLFDDGLKIMSRSPEYQIVAQPDVSKSDTQRIVEERDKGFVFKKMLSKNLEVLQRWLELFYSIYGDDKRFDFYLLVKAEQALQDVHLDLKCVDWGKKKKDFEPGVYNVQEGVIGSQAAWARARPNSLENIFTFIHQSQLVLLAAFTHGILGDVFELLSVPSLVKKIDQVLKKLSDQNCCISLVGVLFKGKALTLSYNWPQRNHSASIEVQFASTTGEVFFTFSMFGDGGAFWKHYLSALEVSSLAKAILPYDKRLSERGFAITWKFADAEAKNLVSVAAWIKEVVDSALNIRSKKEIFNPKKVSLSTWTLYTYFQDEGDFESALKSADNEALNEFIQRLLSDPFYVKRSIESSDYNEIARLIVRALSEELTRDQTSPDTMKERLQMLRPGDALLGNYLDLYYGKFLLERGFEGQLPIDFMRHVLNLLHLDKSFAFKELLSLFGNNFALRAELIKVFLFLFGTEVNQELFLAVYPFILEEMATNKHAADLTDGLIQALNSIDVASFDTEDKQEFFKEILRGPFLRRFQDSVSQKIFDSYIFPMLEQSNGSTEKILLILGALYSDDKDTAGFSKQEKALANYTFKEWKSLFEERNEFFVMPGLGGLLQTGFISKEEVLAFFAQQIDTYFTWIKKEQQRQLASFIELLTVFLKYVLLEGNSEEAVEKALDYLKQLSSLGLSFNEATVIGALEGLWGEFPRLMRLVRRKLRKVALRFPEMFFKNYMKFLPIKNQIGLFGSRDRSFKARDLIQNISADSLRSWRETLLASGELNEANYAEGGRAFFEDFNTSLG